VIGGASSAATARWSRPIAADATLVAQGVSAVALGTRLVTNYTMDATYVADPGLSTSPVAVPSLSPLGFGLAALLMLGSRRALARRSA